MIQLDKLTIGYSRDAPILSNIDFKFEDNKIYGILGKSGYGKTTLLKTIAGLLKPLYGAVYVNDNIIKYHKPSDIYMMFQNYTSFDWLNCLENVTIARKVSFSKITHQDVDLATKWLIAVGLGDHMYKYPKQLSGGMRQRLALARSLFMGPRVLLMDEPLSALDENTRAEMQKLIIKNHNDTQNIIIMITHSKDEANRLCDYIINFDDGGFAQPRCNNPIA